MARRPSATRRWLTAAIWPLGVSLTSWDYMWRSTPLHRREMLEERPAFQKVLGDEQLLRRGDEFVVRMPGPFADGIARGFAGQRLAAIFKGSFENAARLIRGYEFADPSIVRAFYEAESPLKGRNMVLELRALGLVTVHVGVRVAEVYDDAREVRGRPVRVCGWGYRTLKGHVEKGQMDWQVWKWTDSGAVEFHVHAVSRPAPIANPILRLGFLVLRRHERALFLDSTQRRMRELTEAALRGEDRSERIRHTSEGLTARRLPAGDPAHDELARRAGTPDLSR